MDGAVPQIARLQGGAFTRRQAECEGWSPRRITARLASGHWVVVCGSGLAAAGTVTASTQAWAAHLSRPDAVVSHLTAAELYRFPVEPSPRAHVTAAADVKHGLRGAYVHHVPLEEEDVVLWAGDLRVTGSRRTALDCLRVLPATQGEALWAWLATRDVLRRRHLVKEVAGSTGRWGTPRLARLLRDTQEGAFSEAERRLHRLLRRAGLGGWQANARIIVNGRVLAVVDVLFARDRVVVEVDGWSAHAGPDAFTQDRRRQNDLVGAGYVVLRFTWADLTQRPDDVVRRIQQALDRVA